MHDNAQVVNNPARASAQPGIGHNRQTLAQAAEANLETGVLLLCKEALITAIQDKRLERGHLRVLAAIATCINSRTAKAWPDRSSIAALAGMTVRSVANALSELRGWGYLVADRETVQEAGGKRLTVYTFGNIDHDGIRREIAAFVHRLRQERDKPQTSPPTVTPEDHRPRGQSPQTVTNSSPSTVTNTSPPTVNVTAHGAETSPPTVHSNSYKELIDSAAQQEAISLADLRERLMSVAGDALANEASAPGLLHIGIVAGWIDNGCDFELDIVPAVKNRAQAAIRSGRKIHSWSYFTQAVADAKAERTRPMPAGNAQPRQQKTWRDEVAEKNARMSAAIAGLK